MSDVLERLKPTLLAIPASDVDEPDIPIAAAFQEAADLEELIEKKEVRARLEKADSKIVPALDALPNALQAARDAESIWKSARNNTKHEDQAAREAAGFALRSEMLAACRYHLKKDRSAQAAVSVIVQGEGIADLVQDLNDLAELVTKHSAAFADDDTFDADASASRARALAPEIASGAARGGSPPPDHVNAKELRDRAYTHLDDLVDDIREAGKYAKYPEERARAACRRASYYGSTTYQSIKNILTRALDLEPLPTSHQRGAQADEAPRFARPSEQWRLSSPFSGCVG